MRERWKAARWGRWNRPETVRLQGVGADRTLFAIYASHMYFEKHDKNFADAKFFLYSNNFLLKIILRKSFQNTHALHWLLIVCGPSRRAYWRMSQRVDVWSRLSPLPDGATGKPSVNSAFVLYIRPEARASLSWAGWTFEKSEGRPELFSRAILSDDLR